MQVAVVVVVERLRLSMWCANVCYARVRRVYACRAYVRAFAVSVGVMDTAVAFVPMDIGTDCDGRSIGRQHSLTLDTSRARSYVRRSFESAARFPTAHGHCRTTCLRVWRDRFRAVVRLDAPCKYDQG